MKSLSFKKHATNKKDDNRPIDYGLKVHIYYNDIAAVEGALRRLKKRMETEQVMETFFAHEFFTKKSTKLRERRKKAQHLSRCNSKNNAR